METKQTLQWGVCVTRGKAKQYLPYSDFLAATQAKKSYTEKEPETQPFLIHRLTIKDEWETFV